jgi:hypothetical protein
MIHMSDSVFNSELNGKRRFPKPISKHYVRKLWREVADKNKDGKVSKEELPERMQGIVDRADANKDGAMDKKELRQMAERFGQSGRPARGRGEGEGDRPARPRRPTEE